MAGIYIHIPFCKQACHYCNFHFSTSFGLKDEMVSAILKEIDLQKSYLLAEKVNTVYFGGGTPSVLNAKELSDILDKLTDTFNISPDAEITLEANPDDLDIQKLEDLRKNGINRLSVGVQSFFEEDLLWMNRSHDVKQSHECIINAQRAGFDNISIDLIFGSPTTSNENWKANLDYLIKYKIPHVSCYGLTVEPDTALHHFVKSGKSKAPNEELSALQFEETMKTLTAAGYQHYEISNYAHPEKESKHNSNYWKQEKYLGIGPAAHSFNGESRQWNVAHNKKYIDSINSGRVESEIEMMSAEVQYNEYILTGLRTMWGCELKRIKSYGESIEKAFLGFATPLIEEGKLYIENDVIHLSPDAKLLADHIISELFIT